MYQTMPDHLVLAFEAFTTFAAWTSFDRAEVWSSGRVDVGV